MAVYYIEFYFLRKREEEGGKRREEGGERTPSRICYRVSELFSLLLPLYSFLFPPSLLPSFPSPL